MFGCSLEVVIAAYTVRFMGELIVEVYRHATKQNNLNY